MSALTYPAIWPAGPGVELRSLGFCSHVALVTRKKERIVEKISGRGDARSWLWPAAGRIDRRHGSYQICLVALHLLDIHGAVLSDERNHTVTKLFLWLVT